VKEEKRKKKDKERKRRQYNIFLLSPYSHYSGNCHSLKFYSFFINGT